MEGECNLDSFLRTGKNRINPRNWRKRDLHALVVLMLMVILPLYLYFGFQPANSIDASKYPSLDIPAINLSTPVLNLEMKDRQLIAPAEVAGSYTQADHKLFIIGHSTTVFKKLKSVNVGDTFSYAGKDYSIVDIETKAKADIDMRQILAPASRDTIIIMTCAGDPLPNQDATHRLIVTAVASGEQA